MSGIGLVINNNWEIAIMALLLAKRDMNIGRFGGQSRSFFVIIWGWVSPHFHAPLRSQRSLGMAVSSEPVNFLSKITLSPPTKLFPVSSGG
jgi:hypothetical protein